LAQDDISVNISTNADEIDKKIKQLTKTIKQLEAQNKKAEGNISSNKQRIQQIDQEINADKKLTAARKRKITSLKEERAALGRAIGGYKTQIQVRQRDIESLERNRNRVKAYGQALDTVSRPALRYALYDLSNNLRQVAIATAALAVAPIGIAIKYEREFANVIRTNELAGESAQTARNNLLEALRDINQASPISWSEITDIATLAGQLGIAENLVASFTDNVAKFAATTDLTVDAASTAFGRLNQLIDGVDGQFEQLGSAILAVGVDSVATESQIVNVSTQIASMGNLAQLSAADIVGLSGALASLGIRPELARGTITRFFSEINASIAGGGFQLEEFARLSGRTAEEFTSDWGTSQSINVVLDFLDGLGATAGEAERVLRDLGITSVRDIPALLRLAQSSDEVRRLVELSNEEFVKGQKIQEQYAIIAGTTAEELRRLGQNFEALLAAVGSSVPGLAQFFAALSNVTAGITDFLSTTPGKVLSGVAIALALVVSAATAAGAIVTSLLAGFSALVFASRMLGIDLSIVGIKSLLTAKGLQSVGLGALAANKSFKILFNTIKFGTLAFGVIGVAIATVGGIMSAYGQRVQQVQSITNALLADQEGLSRALEADAENYNNLSGEARALADGYVVLEKATIGLNNETEELAKLLLPRDVVKGAEQAADRLAAVREVEAAATQRQAEAADELLRVQGDLESSSANATSALEAEAQAVKNAADEYLILGQNVALYLRRQVAESPEIRTALEVPEFSEGIVQQFGDVDNLIDVAFGDPEEARRRADLIIAEVTRVTAQDNRFSFVKDLSDIEAVEVALEGILQAANPENILNSARAFGDLNDNLAELEAQSSLAEGKVDGLLDSLFGAENAAASARDAVGAFFDDLAEGADTSDITSESFQSMIEAIAGNEFRSVQDRIGDLNVVLERLKAEGQGTSDMAVILTQVMLQLAAAAGFADAGIGSIPANLTTAEERMDFLISKAEPLIDLLGKIGVGADTAGNKMSGAGARAKTLAEQFDELADSIFSPTNAARSAASSIADLGESYAELGEDAFFASSEIQDAVSSILASSASPEEGVANLNALYAQLARTVGSSTAPSLQFLRNVINQVAGSFGVAADAVAGATVNLDFFNLGVQNAQQEVRTLSDYAGDLEEVISRAFDIRFASTFDIDRIAEAWFDLGSTVEDARFQVEELIASQSDLGSDRALKEYFLSVAEAYNDTLRAAQLRKEIADLDREQAQNARELEEAQQIAGGDLTAQGPGSRQNRAALLELVQNYQDYITTLAESGASQQELTAATSKARAEFIEQARELGRSSFR
jgi:TP901 family phage tail tape measure protein